MAYFKLIIAGQKNPRLQELTQRKRVLQFEYRADAETARTLTLDETGLLLVRIEDRLFSGEKWILSGKLFSPAGVKARIGYDPITKEGEILIER